MALVTTKDMLLQAQQNGYAVSAFNVENMEMVMAVIEAAEGAKSPVIMQITPSTVKYGGLALYFANVKAVAEHANVPVAIHLDHGSDFVLAMQAMRTGYTFITIDGSHQSFAENIAVSKKVADACLAVGVPVEKTGVTSLAIAIGTAHGLYKGEPKLDLQRLFEIPEVISISLVLHGASGVPDITVQEVIKRGICKVNYATELRIAFSNGIKETLKNEPEVIDSKKYGKIGKEYVKKFVLEKMQVCGSAGKVR